MRRLVFLLLLLWLWLPAWSQSEVSAQLDTDHTVMGQPITLTVTVSGSGSPTEPNLPPLDGFQARSTGVSQQISIINGQTSTRSVYNYLLSPTRPGTFRIPSIHVEVNGETFTTAPLEVVVDPSGSAPSAPGGPPNPPPWGGPPTQSPGVLVAPRPQPSGPEVFVEADVSDRHPYVDQPVVYSFRLFHRVNLGQTHYEPPETTGFLKEDLKQRTYQVERNGAQYSVSEARTVLFPTAPGQFTIGPTRLTCQVIPDSVFSDPFMFTDPVKELVTESVAVDVRSLPGDGRPGDFTGGVGTFKVEAHFNKSRGKQGDPVTLLVTVEGDGHPDFLTDLTVPPSEDFRIFKPESRSFTTHQDEFRGHRLYQIPLVPLKAGKLTIPALHFSFFDWREKRYKAVETQPLTLEVDPGKVASAPSASPTPGADATPSAGPSEPRLRPPHDGGSLSRPSHWESSAAFWLAQALPWLASLLYVLARWMGGHWQRSAAERHQGSLYRRTRARLRKLPEDQIAGLLLAYLEGKTGQGWLGCSLNQMSRRLQEGGVSAAQADALVRLLTDLEALRYAPPGAAVAQSDALRKQADELLVALEKELG